MFKKFIELTRTSNKNYNKMQIKIYNYFLILLNILIIINNFRKCHEDVLTNEKKTYRNFVANIKKLITVYEKTFTNKL
jgi:hypothetical protein